MLEYLLTGFLVPLMAWPLALWLAGLIHINGWHPYVPKWLWRGVWAAFVDNKYRWMA